MSESYDVTGIIEKVGETQTFGDKGFAKRELWITVPDGTYPQTLSIEFVQDKCALLDSVKAGQEVTIGFNLRGREYNNRVFNNLQGWRIKAESASQKPPPSGPVDEIPMGDDSDIPF